MYRVKLDTTFRKTGAVLKERFDFEDRAEAVAKINEEALLAARVLGDESGFIKAISLEIEEVQR